MSVAFSKALVPSRSGRKPQRQIERTRVIQRTVYADVSPELYGALQSLSLTLPDKTMKGALLHVIQHWQTQPQPTCRASKRRRPPLSPPLPFRD